MAKTAIYSDVDANLTKATDGDVTRQTELDAITNSLTNIVSTLQGGRRMLQEFAVAIHNLLFEPIDSETSYTIAERVIEGIEYWDPRVEVLGFDIEPRPDDGEYRCRVNYRIRDSLEEEAELKFVLKAQ